MHVNANCENEVESISGFYSQIRWNYFNQEIYLKNQDYQNLSFYLIIS